MVILFRIRCSLLIVSFYLLVIFIYLSLYDYGIFLLMGIIALFYAGYGATMVPAFGIIDAYGGYTSEYYNALGFFVLCEFNLSRFVN